MTDGVVVFMSSACFLSVTFLALLSLLSILFGCSLSISFRVRASLHAVCCIQQSVRSFAIHLWVLAPHPLHGLRLIRLLCACAINWRRAETTPHATFPSTCRTKTTPASAPSLTKDHRTQQQQYYYRVRLLDSHTHTHTAESNSNIGSTAADAPTYHHHHRKVDKVIGWLFWVSVRACVLVCVVCS